MAQHPSLESSREWLVGGGEMGELIRSMDWSRTPLGPIESWPPTLRTMVGLLLANRFPLLLWWGPDYVQIYNDAYRPIPGAKHPRSMGQPARECWTEIWPIIGPLIDTPYHGGPPTWDDDILLVIDRRGFLEETHFTIAYSPVPDATAPGGIGGVLATVHEITAQVIQARRVAALRDLGARSSEAKTAEEACAIAAEALERHALDVPFALLYLVDGDGRTARLAGVCPGGGGVHESFAPPVVSLEAGSPWPLAEAFATEQVQVVDDLDRRVPVVPAGPWPDPPRQALVLPVSSIPHKMVGLLVVGVSARNPLDDGYRGFFELATAQVASALANARAYEEERRRAEALAEIDRAKTVFFSNVSHEFRTPLALMLAPLEDALEDPELPLAPPHRERLETAYRNSLRLLKLVNTLLDFSRIEAGRIEAYYEPTDLAALTGDLASNFRSAMDRAGLGLVVDCPPLPEPVHVDRDMWEKIVLNLLSNAFKFTLEGEIAVTLRSTGDTVELAVRDTGSGIAPEEIPRLFERFYRPKGGRARTHEGTGIGLPLVQELVRLHGGAVRVESAPGVGSTFTVSIPAVTPGAHDQPAPRTLASTALGARPFVEEALRWLPDVAVEACSESRAATAPARILLADDNADMREYVSRLLREHWMVEAVADGRAALETARAHAPDLVLTDVMMPGLDGFELLRALRDDPRTSTIPVILLSARAGEEARVEGLQAGADDYVVKPFTARELVARVRTHLALARIRADVARQAQEARTEAEAASSAKDLFLATLSHELRQPLTSIVGWLRLLQRADTNAGEQGPILQRLERSVGSLTLLIDDLLDVSSIVTGKMRLTLQSVDLRQPIEAAMDTVRASAAAKSIKLESTLDPGTPPIVGDADRLQQVFWNLLSNAVKATPDGGRVSVRLDHDDARATLRVIDSGRGISAEFMPRLFDRFSQAAAGGRRALPGLGLGLAIVRHLVELHGGTIAAESPGENQGATFTVALPIPAGQPDAAAMPQRSSHVR